MEESFQKVNDYSRYAMDLVMEYGPKLVGGILFLIIGFWVAGLIVKGIDNSMKRKKVDVSLRPFLKTMLNYVLKILVVISVLGMIGIEMTSFIALLGAAGLAIGMAFSGTLQNFAGGILILIQKNYKAGDVIEAQGIIASVVEIQIFNTILKSWDNKTIIIPNSKLSNEIIINYTTEPLRKVEWTFRIAHEDDIDKAKQLIIENVFTDERVLDAEKEYFINVAELADSSVNIKVRATVKGDDYWQVFFDMTEKIKKAFDKNGITIPFPQRDVHMIPVQQ